MKTTIFKREIKTFVKRQRKLSIKQQKAYDEGCKKFLLSPDMLFDFNTIFSRNNEKILEIGFGDGENLWQQAQKNPDCDYVGIEVHEPGVAELMYQLIENNIHNVRIIQFDAVKIIEKFPDNIFSRVNIYFPDPWPKKKHHKRRLINPHFVNLLKNKLIENGIIHCATDWENYAEQMMEVLTNTEGLKNCRNDHQFVDNKQLKLRINTRFEKRGVDLGHVVRDILFFKI